MWIGMNEEINFNVYIDVMFKIPNMFEANYLHSKDKSLVFDLKHDLITPLWFQDSL
jgi:hypothetical protein